jgi:hypothetical protein
LSSQKQASYARQENLGHQKGDQAHYAATSTGAPVYGGHEDGGHYEAPAEGHYEAPAEEYQQQEYQGQEEYAQQEYQGQEEYAQQEEYQGQEEYAEEYQQ